MVHVLEFQTEFLGLLHSLLEEFLMSCPELLLILSDLVLQFLEVVVWPLIFETFVSDELSVLLRDFVDELRLAVEVLAPRKNVQEKHRVLWICQIWKASDQFAISLIADILQEVLAESIDCWKNLCVGIFRLELILEGILNVYAAVAVFHVRVVVAIDRRGLLALEVQPLAVSRERLSIMRLHVGVGSGGHLLLSIFPYLEDVRLEQDFDLHLFCLVALGVSILRLLWRSNRLASSCLFSWRSSQK